MPLYILPEAKYISPYPYLSPFSKFPTYFPALLIKVPNPEKRLSLNFPL